MQASIRKYKVNDVDALAKLANDEFVPLIRDVEGVTAYYVVDGGDGTATTVTLAETTEAIEASVAAAADWVANSDAASPLFDGPPEISNGEVVAQS